MAGYLCVAENKVGAVEKLFSLTVQGEMQPTNIIISSNATSNRFLQFTQEGQRYPVTVFMC